MPLRKTMSIDELRDRNAVSKAAAASTKKTPEPEPKPKKGR